MAGPAKKQKLDRSQMTIFILPMKITPRLRLDGMIKNAKKKKFPIVEEFSNQVTHVVSELKHCEDVIKSLKCDPDIWCDDTELLSIQWMHDGLKTGQLPSDTTAYKLPFKQVRPEDEKPLPSEVTSKASGIPGYCCLRLTPLNHNNKHLSEPLELLQEYAELREGEHDYLRALAFRRASCVVKSLPARVTHIHQLDGAPYIGGHTRSVIQDILEEGHSQEVDRIESSDEFKITKLFKGIFGVGSKTARKWFEKGLTSVEDVVKAADDVRNRNDPRINIGLAFYTDLSQQVTRHEGTAIRNFIFTEAQKILSGVTVELTGGFRRGKSGGHDVDLLLSHPTEGREKGLLKRLLLRLQQLGLLVYGQLQGSTFRSLSEDSGRRSLKGQLDHFEKWIGVMKLSEEVRRESEDRDGPSTSFIPQSCHTQPENGQSCEHPSETDRRFTLASLLAESGAERDWVARRVDLIVAPASQYYYALVGWTGSKQFNRSLRLYAEKELNSRLTSHGLYNKEKECAIPANSEKEVFEVMKVPYLDPTDRNC